MDVPYFIEEHPWMSASDEATKEFFVTKFFFCLLIYCNCPHWEHDILFAIKIFLFTRWYVFTS